MQYEALTEAPLLLQGTGAVCGKRGGTGAP